MDNNLDMVIRSTTHLRVYVAKYASRALPLVLVRRDCPSSRLINLPYAVRPRPKADRERDLTLPDISLPKVFTCTFLLNHILFTLGEGLQ